MHYRSINQRFGKNSISIGSCSFNNRHWSMCQAKRSPAYLSNWDEVIRVEWNLTFRINNLYFKSCFAANFSSSQPVFFKLV